MGRARFTFFFADALDFHAVSHVFADGTPRQTGRFLKHIRDVVLLGVRFFPVDEDLAFGGGHQLGQGVQEGGFAAARGADDGKELAFFDVEVDPIEDGQIPKPFCEVIHLNLDA